jgi:hypothetical protein
MAAGLTDKAMIVADVHNSLIFVSKPQFGPRLL